MWDLAGVARPANQREPLAFIYRDALPQKGALLAGVIRELPALLER